MIQIKDKISIRRKYLTSLLRGKGADQKFRQHLKLVRGNDQLNSYSVRSIFYRESSNDKICADPNCDHNQCIKWLSIVHDYSNTQFGTGIPIQMVDKVNGRAIDNRESILEGMRCPACFIKNKRCKLDTNLFAQDNKSLCCVKHGHFFTLKDDGYCTYKVYNSKWSFKWNHKTKESFRSSNGGNYQSWKWKKLPTIDSFIETCNKILLFESDM